MEDAPRWGLGQVGEIAPDGTQSAPPRSPFDAGDAGHQPLGVRVARVAENGARGPVLHQLPGVNDPHPVGDLRDNPQVVGDIEDRRVELLLQLLHQVQDTGLGGHVQARGGLVHDQQRRIAGQGHGDDHALLLAAAELMGVAQCHVLGVGHVDLLQHPHARPPGVLPAHVPVLLEDFADLTRDGERGVEGGHRVLVDEGDSIPPEGAKLPGVESQQVLAEEANLARGDPPVVGQIAHDGERNGALAGARLADQAEGLALADG